MKDEANTTEYAPKRIFGVQTSKRKLRKIISRRKKRQQIQLNQLHRAEEQNLIVCKRSAVNVS